MANPQDDSLTTVPIPASSIQAERDRIRNSNDRDQELERNGDASSHNRGYDEAADGHAPTPTIERMVDDES